VVVAMVFAGLTVETGTAGASGAAHLAASKGVLAAEGVTHPGRDYAGSTIREHTGPRLRSLAVPRPAGQVQGIDVSHYQGRIDWPAAYRKGARFVYIKATEATGYTDPNFGVNYTGSYQAGLIRGAYHFALPNVSSGKAQADFFVAHGGGWSADGKTLPPMLDIEYNPYVKEDGTDTCYGLSQRQMVDWIKGFSDEVHARAGRWPSIYTNTRWWHTCTGDLAGFSTTNPLIIARYGSSPGPMPFDWDFQTIWQYGSSGPLPGDQDYFNGDMSQLRRFATGPQCPPKPFDDVASHSTFCGDIAWLSKQGITVGDGDGGFGPGRTVSRQAMAGFLYRLENPRSDDPTCTRPPFGDVPISSPFCGGIAWLSKQGITVGDGDGGFGPRRTVSRQEMAAFLYRLKNPGKDDPTCTRQPFPDVRSSPFCGDIAWLSHQDITGGYPDGGFHPAAEITRQAMAAFLHRLER
jgi:GH25 family lysozyme M1 (1,4-beta-N-acetylmuramidase)